MELLEVGPHSPKEEPFEALFPSSHPADSVKPCLKLWQQLAKLCVFLGIK